MRGDTERGGRGNEVVGWLLGHASEKVAGGMVDGWGGTLFERRS